MTAGLDVERFLRLLRAAGWSSELVPEPGEAIERLARPPVVDVVFVDGISELDRARLLASARDHGAWCVHVRAGRAALPSTQRHQFVAALALDADERQIATTLRAIDAAIRASPPGGEIG